MVAVSNPLWYFLLAAMLLVGAFFVFRRVRSDYRSLGRLSRPVAVLQFGFFCAYATSSYIFLDARFSRVQTTSPLFSAALVLMVLGALGVAFAMSVLGGRSLGREVGGLCTRGLYRYSRNPQLVASFLFIGGYAMLWPSWTGLLWVSLWLPIGHLMVRCEEEHLERLFGGAYRAYWRRTPRYLGLPRT
jgi:protein-S-isoprenylcysteine O-methyltransferase Ste14